MSTLSEEELLKRYEEAKQKVDSARQSVVIESIKEKKWGHC